MSRRKPPTLWRIWSCARAAWLRPDAMGWTHNKTEAGTWSEDGAKERAGNLPVDDKAAAIPEGK